MKIFVTKAGARRCLPALLALLLLAACQTGQASSTSPTTSSSMSSQAASPDKVSANNATQSELAAAFEAAGVSNASKWAREVEEYRPYATGDTGFGKLRGELAKYNPDSATVEQIVAVLSLP